MLNPARDKMLRRSHTKGDPRGRCPACGQAGPLVADRTGGGRPRPVVFGCRCPHPPPPIAAESE